MLWSIRFIPNHLQGKPNHSSHLMPDSPSTSLRDLRIDCSQPLTFRFHSPLARLLAGYRHDLYRALVFPQDPRFLEVHQSNRARYGRLVGPHNTH
jgi:hypothetical protein